MSSRSPAMAFYDTQNLLWGLPRKCSNASQQWRGNMIGIGGLRQCSCLVTAAHGSVVNTILLINFNRCRKGSGQGNRVFHSLLIK